MAMKNYVLLTVQFAFHVLYLHASSDVIFENVTDIISGASTNKCNPHLLEVQRHLIAPRSWTLGTPIPQLKVISEMIKVFQNHSIETLKVIIFGDCLIYRQKERLYREFEDHSPILRHVRWMILSESEDERYRSWSSMYPSLSCDAVFITWPSLDIVDVSEPKYGTVCPKRKKLSTSSYISREAPMPLRNTTVRIGCNVRGSTRHCHMPLVYAALEAFKLYSVHPEWTQNEKEVDLGVANDTGFFTGTLGELQNRTFDLYLVDLAQEWGRFQVLDYMKTTDLQSLTFAFVTPATAAASADVSYFSIDSFAMTLVTAFAVAATLILLNLEAYDMRSLVPSFIYLTFHLVFSLFSQPLNTNVAKIQTKRTLLKTHTRRARKVHERRLLVARALLAIWLFSSVILVTGLKCSLISQLKYPFVTEPIDSVAKLETALGTNTISPCLLNGTGAAEYLMDPERNNQTIYSHIRRHLCDNKTGNMMKAPAECYGKMAQRTHVYINFYTALKQLAWSGNRGVIISKDSLVTFFGSSAAPRGWPYTRSMRRLASRLVESGLILKHAKVADFRNSSMMTAERAESRRALMETAGSSQKPLGMVNFNMSLFVFGIGNIVACLVAFLEIVFPKRRQVGNIDQGFKRPYVKRIKTDRQSRVPARGLFVVDIAKFAVIPLSRNEYVNQRTVPLDRRFQFLNDFQNARPEQVKT